MPKRRADNNGANTEGVSCDDRRRLRMCPPRMPVVRACDAEAGQGAGPPVSPAKRQVLPVAEARHTTEKARKVRGAPGAPHFRVGGGQPRQACIEATTHQLTSSTTRRQSRCTPSRAVVGYAWSKQRPTTWLARMRRAAPSLPSQGRVDEDGNLDGSKTSDNELAEHTIVCQLFVGHRQARQKTYCEGARNMAGQVGCLPVSRDARPPVFASTWHHGRITFGP